LDSDRRPQTLPLGVLLLPILLLGCGPVAAGSTSATGVTPDRPDVATLESAAEPDGTTGATQAPENAGSTDEDPLPPPLPVEPPATARCGEPGIRAAVTAAPVALRCTEDPPACEGRIPIAIENCGPGGLMLEFIDVVGPNGGVMTMNFSPETMLRTGESVEREGFVAQGGDYRVLVHAAERDGTAVDVGPVTVPVSNPALDAERAACTACRGNWGPHGLTGHVGCICATNDAGRECRDGAECEGECVFERFDEVLPGMGVPVGRCSEMEFLFGCNALLRDGVAAEPPQPLPGRSPTICID
jgi:hypothetical protein